MFIFDSGNFKKTYRDGKVYHLSSGDVSGSLHFFNKDVCSSTVEVDSDEAVAYVISSDSFKKLCREDDSINTSYITFLAKEVRKRSNILNNIRFQQQRVAKKTIAFYDTKSYMRQTFETINEERKLGYNFIWLKDKMNISTASLASGAEIVCCFVNDTLDADVIKQLKDIGIGLIAMCCAGYDNVDLDACEEHGITVTRVPAYSPNSVAEFAITLMLACNRKIHKSYNRVKDFNFSLGGLVGFDMKDKYVGIIGTGKIGAITAKIVHAFGCKVLCYDIYKNKELESIEGIMYVEKDEIYEKCDIISLHTPLLPSTKYMINKESLSKMKKGVIIVNTSRGGLVNSKDLLEAILSGHVGAAALDVYEDEKEYFFEDRSEDTIKDSILSQLIACHNVLITSHQAFLTKEALHGIATSVFESIEEYSSGKRGRELKNAVFKEFD